MRYAIAILILAGCSTPSVQSIDFVPAVSVAVGVAEVTGEVAPTPDPTPSGECDNCGGTGKVGDGTVFVPCAVCGGDGKIEAVETPLVEKLLVKEPAGPVDGQRTADNFFEFDATRNIWAPVDHGHTRYTENGHASTAEHLIREHGHARSSASKWTQEELEIAHANSHWWEKTHSQKISFQPKAVSQMSSSCPNGQCGNPSRSRGIFRRR